MIKMYLPILTYHRLLEENPSQAIDPKRISVSAGQFRAHLRWLKRLGYQTVSLADYPERLRNHQPFPSKSFAITFDDGYEDVLTLGLPILQEMGFTAAVFAVPGEFGGLNRWDDGKARLMTEDQLRRLQKAGITIGAHTCSHVHLPQVSSDIAQREIAESKMKLEQTLGQAVTLFAYPYGEYNEAAEEAVRGTGFHAAFATDRAPREHDKHLFHLRRVVIFPRTNVWEILWKVQQWYPAYQDWKTNRWGGGAVGRHIMIVSPHRPIAPSPYRPIALWLPVIIWAAFIFYLSSIPHLRFLPNHWDFLVRKIGHLGVYGILARLLARALTGSTLWSWKKIFMWSLVLTMLYACTDEFHQSFVPGRSATVHDVLIDSAGAWLALGLRP